MPAPYLVVERLPACRLSALAARSAWLRGNAPVRRAGPGGRPGRGGRRRSRPCTSASQRSAICRRLSSRCHRSATCTARGAPSPMPRAYSVERSRAMVRIPRWRLSRLASRRSGPAAGRPRDAAPGRREWCHRSGPCAGPSRRRRAREGPGVAAGAGGGPGAAPCRCSSACRSAAACAHPAYSDETSHRFRSKPATCSEANQPGIPMMPAGVAVGFADGFIELGGRVVRQA
jgi:hypothetical protein